jgi:hypothetical protein
VSLEPEKRVPTPVKMDFAPGLVQARGATHMDLQLPAEQVSLLGSAFLIL